MKQLRLLSLLAILSTIFFSCQKELSNESGNPGPSNAQWEFTEAATFKGTIDTAYLEGTTGLQSLVYEGVSADGKGQIFMQLSGTSITATSFKNPNVVFTYVENGAITYSNVPTETDAFTVVIATINATSVTGTFSGKVQNAAGEAKSISNGKFSASLVTETAPPLQGICKIATLNFLDSASGTPVASLANIFNSANKVSSIQFINGASNQSQIGYKPTYTATRVQLDAEQYFDLDANGRIKLFSGYFDGVKDSNSIKTLITYTFNANGNMIKAAYSEPTAPTVILYEVNFVWTNGNLTQTVAQVVGSTSKTQIDYVYDLSKTAKEFLCFFPNYEVFYTQAAINYGKNSTNLPIKSTVTEYSNGNIEDVSVANFTNYTLDAQNYVTNFNVVGGGSFLPGGFKYGLTYKCY